MYQNVLIPTDGSDGTRRAIEHGLTIANRFEGTVHALSIVPEGPFGTMTSGEVTAGAERAVEYVEREADRVGVPVTTTIERGVPHESVLAYADDNDIDVIVMGTQGRTGLDRFLVGSVTERIVRMAEPPVVTLRMTDDIEIEEPSAAIRIARRSLETGASGKTGTGGETQADSETAPVDKSGAGGETAPDGESETGTKSEVSTEPETDDEPAVLEDPYRTSGTWVVPLKMDDGPVDVHVDAVTGGVRTIVTRE
ncbi:universal stress protein UspA [Halostagnicola larsenii XH-48]|uniref:Universal stress protein UspA n=1 Tax=Halostagnicola larsenii XH-48 TaxID=797299 RepID=W0JKU5_9EURY|nr:universal stress protein [Halostagnicola larsenii]AHF99223.1 universal stress protein UspA [Halostagnicola larsenii XH-48]